MEYTLFKTPEDVATRNFSTEDRLILLASNTKDATQANLLGEFLTSDEKSVNGLKSLLLLSQSQSSVPQELDGPEASQPNIDSSFLK